MSEGLTRRASFSDCLKRIAALRRQDLVIAFSVSAAAMAGLSAWYFTSSDVPDTAYHTMFICSETGKTFDHVNALGDELPLTSPYTGRRTAFPAEPCYWTKEGGTKKTPTWVLLNELAGKSGPTFCPDCDRLVVGHNPEPSAGRKPPVTRQEYTSRRAVDPRADR
ncbi:MAG: hypothetical protein QM770_01215 [Tepidisphaeraceae bacterium]